jgi:hypothetical protein
MLQSRQETEEELPASKDLGDNKVVSGQRQTEISLAKCLESWYLG